MDIRILQYSITYKNRTVNEVGELFSRGNGISVGVIAQNIETFGENGEIFSFLSIALDKTAKRRNNGYELRSDALKGENYV